LDLYQAAKPPSYIRKVLPTIRVEISSLDLLLKAERGLSAAYYDGGKVDIYKRIVGKTF